MLLLFFDLFGPHCLGTTNCTQQIHAISNAAEAPFRWFHNSVVFSRIRICANTIRSVLGDGPWFRLSQIHNIYPTFEEEFKFIPTQQRLRIFPSFQINNEVLVGTKVADSVISTDFECSPGGKETSLRLKTLVCSS